MPARAPLGGRGNPGYRSAMVSPLHVNAFDHVALWVADREALARFLCDHVGMHEIARSDTFTLVGADARRGKLTLFDAPPPRERGVLRRVVLRVHDLEDALSRLPEALPVDRESPRFATFEAPEGLGLGLVEEPSAQSPDYDIDHVVLAVPDPVAVRQELAALGFTDEGGLLVVADKHVELEEGPRPEPPNGTLNHLALLVDSAREVEEIARSRDLRVADVVDAENTLAVFLLGPAGIKLEYVEHKPSFSLV
jgi:catechol 2,3-dioxygenase-like lactoylglutathione lyase family enzyme